MRTKSIVLGLLASSGVVATCPCDAAFMYLSMQHYATVDTNLGARDVYRLYAVFSAPDDRVYFWGTGSQQPTTIIESGPCTSSAFFQLPGPSIRAPQQRTIDQNPDAQWDTFATIGVSIAEQGIPYDQTVLSPGFPPFISGNIFSSDFALVGIAPSAPQCRADFTGDGDPQLRVLLMQATVLPGEYPLGEIGALGWQNGAGQNFQVNQLSWVPLEGVGRCCIPTGTCEFTTQVGCIFLNGNWLACESCEACEQTCLADVAPSIGDGEVDIDDLVTVINSWGSCPSIMAVCPADVSPAPSGNNQVDIDDLLTVINAWGPCR
jgi:hypothetical protein